MNKLLQTCSAVALSIAGVLAPTAVVAQDKIFQEQNGIAVVEIESAPTAGSFVAGTSLGGFTGTGYYFWNAGFTSQGGRGILTYKVLITNPGLYKVRVRNQHNNPHDQEDNDIFMRFNGGNWIKMFANQNHFKWGYETRLEYANHTFGVPDFQLQPGVFTIEISGRSPRHNLDHIHIYRDGAPGALNPNTPQSPLVVTDPGRRYAFDLNNDGWTYTSGAGFAASSGFHGNGRLTIQAGNNANSFAYWDSPAVDLPLVSSVNGIGVFDVLWQVSGSAARANAPTARFRVYRPDFSETYAYEVTSSGDGAFSPDAAGRTYHQWFSQHDANRQFRGSFDLLSFDNTNDFNGSLSLDHVEIRNRSNVAVSGARSVAFYNFRDVDSSFGLQPITNVPGLAPANMFRVMGKGLAINGSSSGSGTSTIFGTWSGQTEIPMSSNKTYAVVYKLRSDEPAGARATLPTIRLRVNDSGYQHSVMTNIESINNNSRTPVAGEVIAHAVWVHPAPELNGRNFILSFDYLLTPGVGGNNPNATVYLESAEIWEYNRFPN